jgi:hypothetical protein
MGVENHICRAHRRKIEGQAFKMSKYSKSGKKVPKLRRRSIVVVDQL